MTVNDWVNEYIKTFGGFPYFLCMGTPDEILIKQIQEAIKNHKEIEPISERVY